MKDLDPTLVVLDTSVLWPDARLEGPRAQALIDGVEHLPEWSIALPEVVMHELQGKYRDRLLKVKKQLGNSARDWERLGGRVGRWTWEEANVDQMVHDYRGDIELRLAPANGQILRYPKFSHEEAAERAISRRRPFRDGGRGYRDYIIWMTVLDVLTEHEFRVAFVTANTRDFGEKSLHPHLLGDLRDRGISENRLLFFDELDAFLVKYVHPVLEQVTELEVGIPVGRVGTSDLSAWAATVLVDRIAAPELDRALAGLDWPRSWNLVAVSECGPFEVSALHRLTSGDIHYWGAVQLDAVVEPVIETDPPGRAVEVDTEALARSVTLLVEFEVVLKVPGFKPGDPYVHDVVLLQP